MKYNLPDNYYQTYDENVRNITLADLKKVSQEVVNPDAVNWFMVGDKSKIIKNLKELGFDSIIDIDADGNVLNPIMVDNKNFKN